MLASLPIADCLFEAVAVTAQINGVKLERRHRVNSEQTLELCGLSKLKLAAAQKRIRWIH